MNLRIPSEFIDVPMIFKFEYFDYLGERADTETTVYPIKFHGDNTVINGEDNLLSGSLYIGNTIGSGIELAGVNSGFIRTIGYEGFASASRTDQPGGFMMYTGSILPALAVIAPSLLTWNPEEDIWYGPFASNLNFPLLDVSSFVPICHPPISPPAVAVIVPVMVTLPSSVK